MSWLPRGDLDRGGYLVDAWWMPEHNVDGLARRVHLDVSVALLAARDHERRLRRGALLRNVGCRAVRDLHRVLLLEDRLVVVGEAAWELARGMAEVLRERLDGLVE